MNCRNNEPARTWFRSDRFFFSNQQWYFYTREGFPVGPYENRIEAEVDAGMLMAQLKDTPPDRVDSVIRNFLLGSGGDLDYVNDPAFTSYAG